MNDPAPVSAAPLPPPRPWRRRWFLGILFRHIARELAGPLVCCVAGFVVLFLIAELFDVLPDFLEARAALARVVLYFACLIPGQLVQVLPMSLLLAVCYTMHRLGRHHEVSGVRGSGISLPHWLAPVWACAVALGFGCYWLGEAVAPAATAHARSIHSRLGRASAAPAAAAKLVFRNVAARRDWVFAAFSRTGPQTGVLLKQYTVSGRLEWELTAAQATHEAGAWHFRDGLMTRYETGADGGFALVAEDRFASLAMPDIGEAPADILIDLRPAEQLTAADMSRLLRAHPNLPRDTRQVFRTTIWQRRAYPFACLLAAMLGVGLVAAADEAHALRGFAGAVGAMIGYYFISHVFVLFGKSGWVPGEIAGLGPTALFLAWAMYEVYRCR